MAKLRKVFEIEAIWKEKMGLGEEKVEAFGGIGKIIHFFCSLGNACFQDSSYLCTRKS